MARHSNAGGRGSTIVASLISTAWLFVLAASIFGLFISAFAANSARALEAHPLPDGRAYEQVSPVYKAGSSLRGFPGLVHASPDGGRFAFYTTPTLPGSVGAQDFGTYLSSRGSEDWSTVGLLPAAELGRESRPLGWTDDLAESFSQIEDPQAGTNGFYAKDSNTLAITRLLPQGTPTVVASSEGNSALLVESAAASLPGANGERNVYLHDKATGKFQLVSVFNNGETTLGSVAGAYGWQNASTGGVEFGYYVPGVMSPDGEDVYFTTLNTVPPETYQLYLRENAFQPQSALNSEEECIEPDAACTVQISQSERSTPDPEGPKAAAFLAATWGEDPAVFFLSKEKLTDDATTGPSDAGYDLYRYDVDAETENLTDLTVDTKVTDPDGADVQGTLGTSSDGTHVYFVANGVLGDGSKEGATLGNCEVSALGEPTERSGECNLYVWAEGKGIHFIARLDANGPFNFGEHPISDEMAWSSKRRENNRTAHVSQDGTTVVFRSQQKLTDYENAGIPEYYRYSEDQAGLSCVTCVPGGAPPLFGPKFAGPTEATNESPTAPERRTVFVPRNLSADGNRFFFETGDRLAPEDVNGLQSCPEVLQRSRQYTVPRCQDVYEWEASGEGSCRSVAQNGGCIYLLSSGQSDQPSFFGDADSNGENIFIFTAGQLVAQDKDQLFDVYDAKVGGGLAKQNAVPPSPCLAGDSCRGATAGTPPEAQPATPSFEPKQKPRKCRKGTRRAIRHGKPVCVRKRTQHRKQDSNRKGQHKSQARAGGGK